MFSVPTCYSQETEDSLTEVYQCCANSDKIRTVTLDYGRVPVDDTAVKAVKICNGSNNDESYEVYRDSITNPLDTVFNFQKYSWVASPCSTIICRILYRPILPFEKSVDYFTIVNRDKEILKLVVRGESIGPNVVISSENLVMICGPGGSARKRVKMINDSDVAADFVFDIDEKQSSCKVNPTEGRVAPRSHVYIVVTFVPSSDGPQSFSLPCLIQHQAPIIMQIYGYCGNKYTKEDHFDIPFLVYPPKEKNGYASYMSDCNRIRSADALSFHPISLSHNYRDFGRVDSLSHGTKLRPPQSTSLINHSQEDILVKWNEDIENIFQVEPNKAKVKGGESCLFDVKFDPNEENSFYARELTASIFWINSEDSEPIYTFSIIASIRVMGHTFPMISSGWIPQYRVPQTIIMPACLPSRSAYATFLITRLGHLPLMFRFLPPEETHFTVKPMMGVINKNHQAIVVEMFPEDHGKLLYERWSIIFNGNANYEVFIDFRGYAEYPCLSISEEIVNFSPTHPGCEKTKAVSVRNTSRHHVIYSYEDIPSLLSIDQVCGEMFANEILIHNWIFRPLEEGDYDFDVTCRFVASRYDRDSETIMEIKVHVAGKSARGYLVAMPSELNFGEQTYDETRSLEFQLINSSSVEIPYVLTLRDSGWPYEGECTKERVHVVPKSGTLCPEDFVNIEISLTPKEQGFHEFSICYSVRLIPEENNLSALNNSSEICKIKYFGVLPIIRIEDLLPHQTGPNISKSILWRLLNIKKLNMLFKNLQPREKSDVEICLPPAAIQQEAWIITFLISNPTSSKVNWSLKRIKLCSCSKTREVRGRTFQRMKYDCPHRNVCTFHPKSGTLKAHGSMTITMELRNAILGETDIKWNLSIGHDRHVCLTIKIIGLSENEPKVVLLYGSRIELKKIYIGDRDPVHQICWLYNPTQNDIAFSLDNTALENVNEEHRSEIFSCENSYGIVRACSFEPILIKFHPRRWGNFEVVVPLMLGNETISITIAGESINDSLTTISKETSQFRHFFNELELPISFNTDHVTVAATPMHNRVTRMIMIRNNLESEVVAYNWKRYELPGIIDIKVEPQTGRIQSGKLQTFRLIVTTGGKPCRLNADVNCEFINQSQKRDYEKKIFIHNSLCEEMKDYFTITEKGTTVPKPEELTFEAPKPFYKALTVRCYIYSPQDEALKTSRNARLKHTPEIEIPVDKNSTKFSATEEEMNLSKFILDGMIWDILQTTNVCPPSKSNLKYSQISMTPLNRKRIQERSYVRPSDRMLERLFESMIFMIVHKEFALDVIHLTQTTDARQVAYQKMWQQVPKQKGLE